MATQISEYFHYKFLRIRFILISYFEYFSYKKFFKDILRFCFGTSTRTLISTFLILNYFGKLLFLILV